MVHVGFCDSIQNSDRGSESRPLAMWVKVLRRVFHMSPISTFMAVDSVKLVQQVHRNVLCPLHCTLCHIHTHSIPQPPHRNICCSVSCAEQLVQSLKALSSEKVRETGGIWTISELNMCKVNMNLKKVRQKEERTRYNSFF